MCSIHCPTIVVLPLLLSLLRLSCGGHHCHHFVSLHNRSKGLLPAGVVGKIGAIPNVGGGKVIDWHCCCNHCIHCCTAIVVAIAVTVVWGSSFHHLVHGCHCTRDVRRCTLLPAGVAWKKVIFPNEGGG